MLYAVNRYSSLPVPTAPEPSKSGAYYTDIVIVRDDLRWASLLMLAIVVCCMVSVFLRSRRPKRGE